MRKSSCMPFHYIPCSTIQSLSFVLSYSFPTSPQKHTAPVWGRGWLSLSEQWNIMILPTEKRQTISSDIWDLTTYFFFLHEIFFLQMGCVLFKKYFPTKSFGVWNGPRRVFSLFRHIRGIYVVTEKNNRLGKDLRRIKENNYRATDTNAIRNPKEVIKKENTQTQSTFAWCRPSYSEYNCLKIILR